MHAMDSTHTDTEWQYVYNRTMATYDLGPLSAGSSICKPNSDLKLLKLLIGDPVAMAPGGPGYL